MAMFEESKDAVHALEEAQDIDLDQRTESRKDENFLHAKDGQWDPDRARRIGSRLKMTADKCNPYIDQIMSELDQSEFQTSVSAASEESTDDNAELYDGLVRNMEYISNAKHIYSYSGRDSLETGISGWRLVHDYLSPESFTTDLLMKQIYNFKDHVYFDPAAKEQSMMDADYCFVLHPMIKDRYEKEFKDGSGQSLSTDRMNDIYWKKADHIIVGEVLYKKTEKIELVKMSDGSIYTDNEDFQKVRDDLLRKGIQEIDRKKRESSVVYQKFFDNGGWLDDEKETVFHYLPVIPIYQNFKISEDKVIFKSAINRLKDIQMGINTVFSRDLEEGSLAPREKIPLTPEQQEGHQDEYRTLNVDAIPVLTYNHIDGHQPPYKLPGPQPNVGLLSTLAQLKDNFNDVSGFFDANMGQNPGLQSGVAIGKQIDKGDNVAYKYYRAIEIAIQHSNFVAVDTFPRVKDEREVVRLVKPDGSKDFATLHDVVLDEQTQQAVELNDLSKGTYEVTTNIGAAFKTQQDETVATIERLGMIDPTIIQTGKDVLVGNVNAPGMNVISDRIRQQMLMQGLIPEDEQTDEEKEQLQVQQQKQMEQQQQPSPQEQAVIDLSQAEIMKANADTARVIGKTQDDMAKNELKSRELDIKERQAMRQDMNAQAKINVDIQNQMAQMEKQQAEITKLLADALKATKEATGADAIVSPTVAEAYNEQAENLNEQAGGTNGTGPDSRVIQTVLDRNQGLEG